MLLVGLLLCRTYNEVSLGGSGWLVTNSNGSISVPASVPGTAHTALLAANKIGDPYFRFNELDQKWIALEDWTFSKNFTVSDPNMLSGKQMVALEFDGIDTVADVFLNGVLLGSAANRHAHFPFHAAEGPFGNHTQLLKPGEDKNVLEVKIKSPLTYAHAEAKGYPYTVPLTHFYNTWDDNDTKDGGPYHGLTSDNRNFVRKAASDFGWDWGPAFVPQGLLGDISLVTFATGHCHPMFTVSQDHSHVATNGSVLVHMAAEVYSPVPVKGGGQIRAELSFEGTSVASSSQAISSLSEGSNSFSFVLEIEKLQVHLWQPAGYGEQHLYNASLTYTEPAGNSQVRRNRIGLRTLELVTDPTPPNHYNKTGETFYFAVNGVEVYAKGANWIPADAFSDRVTTERLDWLLQSAKDAHMNMVRVWGGGVYQPDAFYDLCDEKGLLVWQELMFACALYPSDAAFLSSVKGEVAGQVTRLQHHPSIAIWGGNNENEAALGTGKSSWYPEPKTAMFQRYKADYSTLYIDTAHAALRNVTPASAATNGYGATAFVDSSPSNGVLPNSSKTPAETPYVKRWGSVYDWEYGDLHYYNYDADCEDYTTYPEARFISEHGFQSWPAMSVLEGVTKEEDWSYKSAFFGYRQRHQQGNAQLQKMMARHFKVPPANASHAHAHAGAASSSGSSSSGSSSSGGNAMTQRQLFDSYLYLTQVQQARCYETAINQWRRLKSQEAKTMGVLYWQLNDVWPGPSWSSMEYDGRWRVVHYAVQRAYAPLLLSAFEDVTKDPMHADAKEDATKDKGPTVRAHLTSDLPGGAVRGTIAVHLHAWSALDATPLNTASAEVKVPALGSQEVFARPVQELLAGHAREEVFLRMVFTPKSDVGAAARGASATAVKSVESYHYFTTLGTAKLPDAATTITDVASDAKGSTTTTAAVTVRASATAVFVLLETRGAAFAGKFSENAFVLLPGQTKKVQFTARAPFTVAALKDSLQVRSLRDTY